MPIAMKQVDITDQFDPYKSVLVAACAGCPKMCIAAERNLPYMRFSFPGGKDYFGAYLKSICMKLRSAGIRTEIFRVPSVSPLMCIWPRKLRGKFSLTAERYDAIAVIGCGSAVATVSGIDHEFKKPVIRLSECTGVANFIPRTRFPFTVELERYGNGTVSLNWEGIPDSEPVTGTNNYYNRTERD